MDDAYFGQGQMNGNESQFDFDTSQINGDLGQEQIQNDQIMGSGQTTQMDDGQMIGDENNIEVGSADSDDTISIINQLNDSDKEAVRKYAKSMINKEEPQQEDNSEQPVMEQVIFTKRQLNNIQENFGPSQDELMKKNDRKLLPKKQTRIKNSPFSSPKFS